jgi:hypothetical protein
MIGLDPAKDLLHNYSPTMDSFWFHFVQHVNGVMHEYGYLLRKLKCQDMLELIKSRETLNWCCGDYGFEAHVRLYRLQLNLKVKGVEQKKVKAKRPRSG